jgi:MFS family permease
MAGGGMVTTGEVKHFEGKVTVYVVLTCILAACGGLMFGYDVGISGGVTSMNDFLGKFFPNVLANKLRSAQTSNTYCQYNDQKLQAFTSSLYLAGLVSTFFAAPVTRRYGRKPTMLIAGLCFCVGVVFNAAAQNLAMLIIGRVLLGWGVGFANQVKNMISCSSSNSHQHLSPTHLSPCLSPCLSFSYDGARTLTNSLI